MLCCIVYTGVLFSFFNIFLDRFIQLYSPCYKTVLTCGILICRCANVPCNPTGVVGGGGIRVVVAAHNTRLTIREETRRESERESVAVVESGQSSPV